MAFLGIHNHTDYSNFRLRDSISKVGPLIEYAHSLGHKGIAITEHECISSSLDAGTDLFSNSGWLTKIKINQNGKVLKYF